MDGTALWNVWWIWLSAALILGILEIMVPGYIFLGFAIGAAVMGLLVGFSLGFSALSLPIALVIFAGLSLVAYLALRHFFKLEKGQVKVWDTDIND